MQAKDLAISIGEMIRDIRRMKWNDSLEELGEKTGLDPNNLSRIERGEQLPNTETLLKLIITLEIDINDYKEEIKQALDQDTNYND